MIQRVKIAGRSDGDILPSITLVVFFSFSFWVELRIVARVSSPKGSKYKEKKIHCPTMCPLAIAHDAPNDGAIILSPTGFLLFFFVMSFLRGPQTLVNHKYEVVPHSTGPELFSFFLCQTLFVVVLFSFQGGCEVHPCPIAALAVLR